MEEIIRQIQSIIKEIPSGAIFDAHFVIEAFFKSNQKNANLYLQNTTRTISSWHSQLAKEIDEQAKMLGCKRADGQSYSLNLLGHASLNTAWIKEANYEQN